MGKKLVKDETRWAVNVRLGASIQGSLFWSCEHCKVPIRKVISFFFFLIFIYFYWKGKSD